MIFESTLQSRRGSDRLEGRGAVEEVGGFRDDIELGLRLHV